MSRGSLGRCKAGERKRAGARGRVGAGRVDGCEDAGLWGKALKHLLASAVEELAHARRTPTHKHFHEIGA